jgi:SAM-dependent methyltransferase
LDNKTLHELRSFSNAAARHKDGKDTVKRFLWYGFTSGEIEEFNWEIANLIPSNVKSILEVGCGIGNFAGMIKGIHPSIKYTGFDFVPQNVDDARQRCPNTDFFVGNYWEVLSRPTSWDFIVSVGTLFSTTDQKYVPLLFDLLNSSAPKGFICLALRGRWGDGIKMGVLQGKMDQAITQSNNVSGFYYRGKRDFLRKELVKSNRPFYLFRDGIEINKPAIPEELILPLEKNIFDF